MKLMDAFENSAEFAIKILWSVLIVIPSTWVLITSINAYGIKLPSDIPAWVQAVGSVAAIVAAGLFPVAHEKAREKRERRDILRTLYYLADPLERLMQQLSRSLLETDYLNRWLMSNGSRELSLLGQALNEIPASMVVAFELTLLTDLRFSQGYAEEIDQYLKKAKVENLGVLPDSIRYYDGCKNCISKIEIVKIALLGQIEENQ